MKKYIILIIIVIAIGLVILNAISHSKQSPSFTTNDAINAENKFMNHGDIDEGPVQIKPTICEDVNGHVFDCKG